MICWKMEWHKDLIEILLLLLSLKEISCSYGSWSAWTDCGAVGNFIGRTVRNATRICSTGDPNSANCPGLPFTSTPSCTAGVFSGKKPNPDSTTTLEHGSEALSIVYYFAKFKGGRTSTDFKYSLFSSTDPDGRFHATSNSMVSYLSWIGTNTNKPKFFTIAGDGTAFASKGPNPINFPYYAGTRWMEITGRYLVTTDSTVNKLHLSTHIQLSTPEDDYELILLRQNIYNVQASTPDPNLEITMMGEVVNEFPGNLARKGLHVKAGGTNVLHNIFIRIIAPPIIDGRTGFFYFNKGTFSTKWIKKYCITETNHHVLQFPYIALSDFTMSIMMHNAFNDWTKYTHHKQASKYFVDVSYCATEECPSGGDKYTFKSSAFKDTINSQRQMTVPVTKPFRIKDISSGLCWTVKDGDDAVRTTSRCKDLFVMNTDSTLSHYKTGKKLHLGSYFSTKKIGYPSRFLYWKSAMLFRHYAGWYRCTTNNFFHKKTARPNAASIDDVECNEKYRQQQLPTEFAEVINSIAMKSLLITTTSLGAKTIVACSPRGDLARKYNCFYSANTGASWTGLQSKVSVLQFYLPDEDAMYGLCHKAKSHCKWHIPTNRVISLPKSDFSAARSGNTVAFTILDDFELTKEHYAFPGDETFAVTSFGLYKSSATVGEWSRIYLWAN